MKPARFFPALLLFLSVSAPSRAIEFPCSEICTCARDCYQVCIGKTGNLTNCGSTGRCTGGSKCRPAQSADLAAAIFQSPQEGAPTFCPLPLTVPTKTSL